MTVEFTFSLQPIIKLITRKPATLKMNFISAEPDFFDTRRMVCGNIFCARLHRTCTSPHGFISLLFQFHSFMDRGDLTIVPK